MERIPRECRFCGLLKKVEDPLPGEEGNYRCSLGRFDMETPSGQIPVSYAWRGIWRPNNAVARAQADGPCFELHSQVHSISKKGRKEEVRDWLNRV